MNTHLDSGRTASLPARFALGFSLALAFASAIVALAPPVARAQTTGAPVPFTDGEWIVLSGPARVERGATLRTLIAVEGPTTVVGDVLGDVVALGGDVSIEGKVGGRLVALAGDVHLGPGARVEGDVLTSRTPVLAPGARINGEIEPLQGTLPIANGVLGMFGTWLAMTLSLLVVALVLAWLVPSAAADAVYEAARSAPLAALGTGTVVAAGLPVLGILALVSVLGIPLGLVLLFGLGALACAGYVGGAWWLGRRVAESARPLSRWPRLGWLLLGFGLLRLGALVPGVHVALWIVASTLGLGAACVAAYRARRGAGPSERTGTPSAPPEPLPQGGAWASGRLR